MLQRSRTERQICSCPLDHSRDSVCFLYVVLHIIIIIIIVVIIILRWAWYATYAHRSSSESSFPLCWPAPMKGLSNFFCDFLEFPLTFYERFLQFLLWFPEFPQHLQLFMKGGRGYIEREKMNTLVHLLHMLILNKASPTTRLLPGIITYICLEIINNR